MEFLLGLLVRDGVSTALIIVLVFIWRDINRISKKVEGFNARLYRSDGTPIYQNVKECDGQMSTCRNDISDLSMKVHKTTNDLIRLEMQVKILHDQANKKGK